MKKRKRNGKAFFSDLNPCLEKHAGNGFLPPQKVLK